MAIFIDCSIGIFILYAFLRLLTSLLSKYDPRSFKTGSYGNPFNYRIWMKQAGAYVVCLGGMKIVVLVLFWIVPGLFGAADWCLSWFSDDVQVVISMLLTPGELLLLLMILSLQLSADSHSSGTVVMNIAQFLISASLDPPRSSHSLTSPPLSLIQSTPSSNPNPLSSQRKKTTTTTTPRTSSTIPSFSTTPILKTKVTRRNPVRPKPPTAPRNRASKKKSYLMVVGIWKQG